MDEETAGTPVQAGPEMQRPDLSLGSVAHVVSAIKESGDINSPQSLTFSSSCLVPGHQPSMYGMPILGGASNYDHCEKVKAELRAEVKAEMKVEVEILKKQIEDNLAKNDKELDRIKLERDKAQQSLEIKEREVLVLERERQADKHDAKRLMEELLEEKNTEIKKINLEKEALQERVEDLLQEKKKLQETIDVLNEQIQHLNQTVVNIQNQSEAIQNEVDQCVNESDMSAAIKKSEETSEQRTKLLVEQQMTELLSKLSLAHVPLLFSTSEKTLSKTSLSNSNSPTPNVSPAGSDHSGSKHPSPPSPSNNDQQVN